MRSLQIAFIVVLGLACLAAYATSDTLHAAQVAAEQVLLTAPPLS
jgi:hypothetical protein